MLSKLLIETAAIKPVKGDIGVEIECEGRTIGLDKALTKYWNSVPDGSLRNNGIEYIFKRPINISELAPAMTEWTELTRAARFDESTRTSVHVHRNATGCTLYQVYNVYAFHWLVENMLVEANGKDRVGNMFCLRICDAEDLFSNIIRGIKTGEYMRRVAGDGFRYSALNPAALYKYGSFEWRFIKGLTNPDLISMWVRNLYKCSTAAMQFDTTFDLVEKFRREDSRTFLDHFFEPEFLQFIFKLVPDWRKKMEEGFPFAYELAKKLKEASTSQDLFVRPFLKTDHEDLYPDENLKPPVAKKLKIRSPEEIVNNLTFDEEVEVIPAPPVAANPARAIFAASDFIRVRG